MTTSYAGHSLGRLLHEEGLLPPECADVQLIVPVDDIVQIRFTVNVHPQDMGKIHRAIGRLLEESREDLQRTDTVQP